MSAIAVSLPFAVMPPKEKHPETLQVNVRIPVELLDWMSAYKAAQPFRLTSTQIFEAAIAEWLSRHAASQKPKKKHA